MIPLDLIGGAIAVSTLLLIAHMRRSRARRAKEARFEAAIARHVRDRSRKRHHAVPEEEC